MALAVIRHVGEFVHEHVTLGAVPKRRRHFSTLHNHSAQTVPYRRLRTLGPLYFAAPHSFTGKDGLGLHSHGSRTVVPVSECWTHWGMNQMYYSEYYL
jgi:tRNA U34 5-carboxymethylaminomethyl modifying GTPase MnmE/TrmE